MKWNRASWMTGDIGRGVSVPKKIVAPKIADYQRRPWATRLTVA
jgi:hypothetical protein